MVEKEITSHMRLEMSRSWLERAKSKIPGCAQTFSKSPISFMQGVAPNFLQKAMGAHVWDVDGNRYIDYVMGLGPVVLGHADPTVNAAVRAQMEQGMSFSLPHPIEVEVSELLCELIPCAEMVRFGKNSSDVTAAAVRVARACTEREKVVCCGYHGWQDWYIGSTIRHRGVPEAVRRLTLTFPYNDIGALSKLFEENRGEIACVIMEPVNFDPPGPGFLQQVHDVCHAHGALLIFDEVVTGFRYAGGGAQEYFGVKPDLACFGKAMANGFPLSAIVGRAEVMRLFEEVFFSGTHGGEALSLAACEPLFKPSGKEELWTICGALGSVCRTVRTHWQAASDSQASCIALACPRLQGSASLSMTRNRSGCCALCSCRKLCGAASWQTAITC